MHKLYIRECLQDTILCCLDFQYLGLLDEREASLKPEGALQRIALASFLLQTERRLQEGVSEFPNRKTQRPEASGAPERKEAQPGGPRLPRL